VGWTLSHGNAGNGRSVITLDNDRAGRGALQLSLTAHCGTGAATQVASATPGVRRYQVRQPAGGSFSLSWHDLFPGGCVSIQLHSQTRLAAIDSGLPRQLAMLILGYVRRGALQQVLEQRSGGRLHLT
jgi:hypothetical protein